MSTPTTMDAYPASFQHLAENGYKAEESFTVDFATKSAAIAFRFQWYGFLKALDAEARRLPTEKDAFGNHLLNKHALMARKGRGIMVSHKERTLTFTPRDHTPLSQDIERVNEALYAVLPPTDRAESPEAFAARKKRERRKTQADVTQTRAELTVAAHDMETEHDQ